MDFLECKICNIPYDEEERRPRNAPCGHEWCSACISELIEDSVFLCPKCRQKNKVDICDDLPVNFGLIDVIRAFKTQNISLSQKNKPIPSETSNVDVCRVHQKIIGHRCLKCQRWLCNVCLCSHTKFTGCSTISSSTAIQSMREEQTKSIDMLLSNFEKDSNSLVTQVQEYNDKIEVNTQKIKELKQQSEGYEKEITKLQHLLEQGKQQTEEIVNSKKNLRAINSPYTIMDGIEVIEEMKHALRSWSIQYLGKDFSHDNDPYGISKALKENKDTYIEMVIKDEKRYGKLSQHEGNLHFHTFRAQSITHDAICMPFTNLQKLIPSSPSLVFMELSLNGFVRGFVYLRLYKDLPNIRENIVQIVTGQQGCTLAGEKISGILDDSIQTGNLPFQEMPVKPDRNAICKAKRGDVTASYLKRYLETIYFQIDQYDGTESKVIGFIESGMDIIQKCYDNHSQGVVITDCGIVVERK